MGTLACSGDKTAQQGEEMWGDGRRMRLILSRFRERESNLSWTSSTRDHSFGHA